MVNAIACLTPTKPAETRDDIAAKKGGISAGGSGTLAADAFVLVEMGSAPCRLAPENRRG